MRATRAIIDLSRLVRNTKRLEQRVGGRQLICIIKGDAYGHGAVPVLHSLVAAGYESFGVASLEEALELRQENPEISILIMGGISLEDIAEAHANRIHFSLHNAQVLEQMEALDLYGYCQVKVDTGMHRVGFLPEELPALAERIARRKPSGIFTHLAQAEIVDKTPSLKQVERFRQAVSILQLAGADFEIIHFANSAAGIELDLSFSTHVRAGIVMYGLNPSESVHLAGLEPVMSFKTRISDLREIGPEEGVSYSHQFKASQPTLVATLPVGYADGYKRILSGKTRVFVGGAYRPQIGTITMDQSMIDVTGMDVAIGDEVELFGDHVTADELAQVAQTIHYEIVTNVGKRVRREYIERKNDGL